jgi:hypothetical protein
VNGETIGRLLFIDASLNKRIATELKCRGRAAISAAQAELANRVYDDEMLHAVAERYTDAVIVTSDDHMPEEWAPVLTKLGSTVATIDSYERHPLSHLYEDEDAWEFDTVQRWCHVMQAQRRTTWHRYSPFAHRLWTPR